MKNNGSLRHREMGKNYTKIIIKIAGKKCSEGRQLESFICCS
jgi:hypothetical protein